MMGSHSLLMLIPLIAMLTCAAVLDLRARRIPNWLTFSLIAAGFLHNALGGELSMGQAFYGFLAGFGLTFLLFAIGALGGGDVKLLAGVGAWIGPGPVFTAFLLAAVIGMLMVLAQSLAQRRVQLLLRNSAMVALNLWHFPILGIEHTQATGQSCRSVDRPLPYAVPVLASVACLLVWRITW